MAKPRKQQDGDLRSFDASASAPGSNGNGSYDSNPDPDRISRRAYELYLSRGGADGQAIEDWLAAERELTSSEPSAPRGDRGE